FKSVNTKPLAKMEKDEITVLLDDYRKRNSARKLCLKPKFNEKAALVKFHPSINPQIIEWYLDKGYRGLILEGTGLGHVGKYCFSAIQGAIENDMLVAMTSQCLWGRLGMTVYDQGRDLIALGVLPLEDMLPETALVKLMWVFGQTTDIEKAKKLLQANIAHEISPRTLYD
ncbi:MAG: Glu-tRNA(Gln) amidotransferase GatDE subunit D, partial [Candidatus Bathyarchaeota archaeon]